jgi:cell wall-associated NlpC family hydrolase
MSLTELELRRLVVAEAESWIGTPYISNGAIKGKRGGTDCAMLLVAVYGNVGLIPKEYDPRPYPADWHVHQSYEKYMEQMLLWAQQVRPPPRRSPLPGDIVMFKIGRVFAHGAIITNWPHIIHAVGMDKVGHADVSRLTQGKRALARVDKHFFTPKVWQIG